MDQHSVWTTWYVLYLENMGNIYCYIWKMSICWKRICKIVGLVVKPLRLKDPTFCLLVFDAFCCFVQQIYIFAGTVFFLLMSNSVVLIYWLYFSKGLFWLNALFPNNWRSFLLMQAVIFSKRIWIGNYKRQMYRDCLMVPFHPSESDLKKNN